MNTQNPNKANKPKITERRRFLTIMAQSVGLSALGGIIWTGYVEEAKASPLLLRPPAALPEHDFLRTCIKCGQCAEACPYDTLIMAKPGDGLPMGTPYFIPRDIPCYMCTDIPCVPPCPTGALDQAAVTSVIEGKEELDINKARMGLAVVDHESCIAFWGIQCDACYRACPILGEAITIEFLRNERTGKHAKLVPVVHADYCTGCGLCEHACVTEKAAIFVLPRDVAMGKPGDYYVKGWSKEDQERIKQRDLTKLQTKTKISEKSAVESLNMGDEELFDE